MIDDGRCHICRRVPLARDPAYRVTTCVDCEATREETMSVSFTERPPVDPEIPWGTTQIEPVPFAEPARGLSLRMHMMAIVGALAGLAFAGGGFLLPDPAGLALIIGGVVLSILSLMVLTR